MANVNTIFGFSPRLQGALDTRIARLNTGHPIHTVELPFWQAISPLALAAVTELNSQPHICLQLLSNALENEDRLRQRITHGPVDAATITPFLQIDRLAASPVSIPEISFDDAVDLLGKVISADDLSLAIACMMTYINNFCFPNISRLDPEVGAALTERLGKTKESQEWRRWQALEAEAFSADAKLLSLPRLPLQFGPGGMTEDSRDLMDAHNRLHGRRHNIPPFNHPLRSEALGTIPINFFEEAENAARFLLGLLE
ncbi:hypothetical protein A2276_00580 [candidate division WOR-1 bacterium RIFOXYA12_FULL_43_27]|uniref:Uncharacterized protein n=1 Tax=candidate division WOR-1 bacterium RIFOXYC2_FULL_46_14 TaxID=1802587 RepID=A0A1F4U4E8_UNCSA|nr:MAG: hypothetical protein A2276_00580 [candidate division WOR-1 bacterium RIFOXYA12_FULL_43_27]OGC20813.1 MAG: hypothetical protein A2292_07295 [candidate division WOR-1 bacterium RIFOXYB2_FULL_46_45]OGC31450.1 MAG: hypothetical protein A2232_04155 [candidate division WOR-1 bacterium RIFOXYA2_FULL_46_56]OGC39855.1 MAG: hypothetical protein A2438_04990 [candidate division WOR-1 bacterium RIFOXYC2_FULL_46_14]